MPRQGGGFVGPPSGQTALNGKPVPGCQPTPGAARAPLADALPHTGKLQRARQWHPLRLGLDDFWLEVGLWFCVRLAA
jgi:hypothetical protein